MPPTMSQQQPPDDQLSSQQQQHRPTSSIITNNSTPVGMVRESLTYDDDHQISSSSSVIVQSTTVQQSQSNYYDTNYYSNQTASIYHSYNHTNDSLLLNTDEAYNNHVLKPTPQPNYQNVSFSETTYIDLSESTANNTKTTPTTTITEENNIDILSDFRTYNNYSEPSVQMDTIVTTQPPVDITETDIGSVDTNTNYPPVYYENTMSVSVEKLPPRLQSPPPPPPAATIAATDIAETNNYHHYCENTVPPAVNSTGETIQQNLSDETTLLINTAVVSDNDDDDHVNNLKKTNQHIPNNCIVPNNNSFQTMLNTTNDFYNNNNSEKKVYYNLNYKNCEISGDKHLIVDNNIQTSSAHVLQQPQQTPPPPPPQEQITTTSIDKNTNEHHKITVVTVNSAERQQTPKKQLKQPKKRQLKNQNMTNKMATNSVKTTKRVKKVKIQTENVDSVTTVLQQQPQPQSSQLLFHSSVENNEKNLNQKSYVNNINIVSNNINNFNKTKTVRLNNINNTSNVDNKKIKTLLLNKQTSTTTVTVNVQKNTSITTTTTAPSTITTVHQTHNTSTSMSTGGSTNNTNIVEQMNENDDFENLIRANEIINKKHVAFQQNNSVTTQITAPSIITTATNTTTNSNVKQCESQTTTTSATAVDTQTKSTCKIVTCKKESVIKSTPKIYPAFLPAKSDEIILPCKKNEQPLLHLNLTATSTSTTIQQQPSTIKSQSMITKSTKIKSFFNKHVLKIPNYYKKNDTIISTIDLAVQQRKRSRDMKKNLKMFIVQNNSSDKKTNNDLKKNSIKNHQSMYMRTINNNNHHHLNHIDGKKNFFRNFHGTNTNMMMISKQHPKSILLHDNDDDDDNDVDIDTTITTTIDDEMTNYYSDNENLLLSYRNPKFWITSGPPLKLDTRKDKMEFLEIFNLTTYSRKNDYALQQLSKRKWKSKWTPILYEEEENTPTFELPIPLNHPEILNNSPDFPEKSCFLRELGLRKISNNYRDEMETVWKLIIQDRLKRGFYSPLTIYFIKAIDEQRRNVIIFENKTSKTQLSKYYRKNSLNHHRFTSSSSRQIENVVNNGTTTTTTLPCNGSVIMNHCQKTVLRIPAVQLLYSKNYEHLAPPLLPPSSTQYHHQHTHATIPTTQFCDQISQSNIPVIINLPTNLNCLHSTTQKIEPNCSNGPTINTNTVNHIIPSSIPISNTQILENHHHDTKILNPSVIVYPTNRKDHDHVWQMDEDDKSLFKWPGPEAILASYKEYSKAREIQIQHEKNRCQQICDETKNCQMQIEYLDRRLQYLQNIHCLQQDSQRTLENTIEIYKKFIDTFR